MGRVQSERNANLHNIKSDMMLFHHTFDAFAPGIGRASPVAYKPFAGADSPA
jgi:hypothetical protein